MTNVAADPQAAHAQALALADAKRRELMRRELARRHMIDFVRYVTPWYQDAGFRTALCDVLDAFARRQILRLKITVPPQHGKSFLVSEHLPAFLLGREPDSRVMLGSYNQRFANKWGRAVQRIMRRPAYAALFPGSKIGSGSGYTAAVDEFDIQDRRGGFKAVGFGAGITGNPFHYGIIDDPIKGRSEADSAVVRENIWDTYTGEFYTRQNPMGAAPICLMSTRWHDDDPHGRTDRQERAGGEKWTVFNFPAIDKQGRPLLFSAEAYAKVKFTLGSRDWQSLYQQEPMLEGGTVFKERWFRRYVLDRATLPESVRGGWCVSERPSESPDGKLGAVTVHRIDAGSLMRFITVDPALTEKESADYSVVDVWGYDSDRGDLYLLDHWRDQVSSPDLLDKIGQQLNLWRCVRVYVESVAFQKSLIQFADRLDWPVTELVADRDKLARAYAAAPLVEQGRVYVPTSAEWWPVLQHELLTFPQSDRKDQVDSFAYGCLVIREGLGGATIGPTAGSDPGPTGGRLNPHRYAQRWQAGGGRRFSAR